jgi:hypothetical protein
VNTLSQFVSEETIYFTTPGKLNTSHTLKIVKENVVKHGIKTVLLASTLGYTIEKADEGFKDLDVRFIVVGGRRKQFPEHLYSRLVDDGHSVIFHSEQCIEYPDIVWEILRRFSEGMKVCVQMSLMASDLGILREGEIVIAVAGTGREDFPTGGGADTAVLIEATRSERFFKLDLPQSETKIIGRKIKHILCRPK